MAVQCVKQEKWTEYLQREGILLDMKFDMHVKFTEMLLESDSTQERDKRKR